MYVYTNDERRRWRIADRSLDAVSFQVTERNITSNEYGLCALYTYV
jgi:hypothetical protein